MAEKWRCSQKSSHLTILLKIWGLFFGCETRRKPVKIFKLSFFANILGCEPRAYVLLIHEKNGVQKSHYTYSPIKYKILKNWPLVLFVLSDYVHKPSLTTKRTIISWAFFSLVTAFPLYCSLLYSVFYAYMHIYVHLLCPPWIFFLLFLRYQQINTRLFV